MALDKWINPELIKNDLGEDVKFFLYFLESNRNIIIKQITNPKNLDFFISMNQTFYGLKEKRKKKRMRKKK